jgi:hypothetical protein
VPSEPSHGAIGKAIAYEDQLVEEPENTFERSFLLPGEGTVEEAEDRGHPGFRKLEHAFDLRGEVERAIVHELRKAMQVHDFERGMEIRWER